MKKIILAILLINLCPLILFPQGCLPEGITFSTQAQIDNFQSNYPGCTDIEGDVTISGDNITNLNGLNVLTSIGGNLWINNNSMLPDFTGLNNLESVGGYLNISDNEIITGMTGLNNLSLIGGSLYISTNPSLLNLGGLENVSYVPGDLQISSNTNLNSTFGLIGLTSIGGSFSLISNLSLTELTSLNNLTNIGGDFLISYNPSLGDLFGLDALFSIGNDLIIQSNNGLSFLYGIEGLASVGNDVVIYDNNELSNLYGFSSLSAIGGDLIISGNDFLVTLQDFPLLNSIGGDLSIGYNNAITNLYGLENLLSIGGNLTIEYNNSLTNLEGLNNLDNYSISNLYINNNGALFYCDVESICQYLAEPNGAVYIQDNDEGCNSPEQVTEACDSQQSCLPNGISFTTQDEIDHFQINYPGCNQIEGDVVITGNDITNLNGLTVLNSINGGLGIANNPSLAGLSGLENLNFTGHLGIIDNDLIENMNGLEGLTAISGNLLIGYDMPGQGNASLNNLTGLEGLVNVGGYVGIYYNEQLESLTGLENLISVGGSMEINNTPLTNLTGLESLSNIGEYLLLKENSEMVSLQGLTNLNMVGTGLHIWDNDQLTSLIELENIDLNSITYLSIYSNNLLADCDAQNICEYLSSPNAEVDIHDNAPGCNSEEEVQAACLTPVEEINTGNGITIIPNPAKDKITISSPAITGNTQLSIFNVSGEKVFERQLTGNETQIDISSLPRGVYFVQLQNEKMVEVGKMVKE